MPNKKNKSIVDLDIYRAGVVADLSFNFWCASTKLKEGDLGLANLPKDKISLGSKRLAKKERLDKIFTVRAKAKNFFKQNSFSFPFGGARFIPYARLEKLVAKELEFEKRWFEEVDKFAEEYDDIRAQMLKEYEIMFEELLAKTESSKEVQNTQKMVLLSQLQEKYPSKSDLRKRFNFEFTIFEVNSPEFQNISATDAVSKVKKAEDREKIYREKYIQKIDVFLDDVVANLKTMVLDIVQKLQQRVDKDCIKMSTIRSFQRFAESFRALDFVDTNIDHAISSLEEKLKGVTKSDLDDKAFQAKFVSELDKVKEAASSIDISKVLGKFKRNIRVIEETEEEKKGE